LKKLQTRLWRITKTAAKYFDPRDRTMIMGLSMLGIGVAFQFTPAYACIVLGVVLSLLAWKGTR
jgi:hypothetical protein